VRPPGEPRRIGGPGVSVNLGCAAKSGRRPVTAAYQ
jgi:hypothetical protein